jgi:N utilization substance protein A
VLSNGKRCPNAALPGSKYCGVPAHQELALHEPNEEDNPIVAESEPELEELSDTAEPEAVTEDAAAFGDPEPEEFAAGPGDAPVAGEDETLDSGSAHVHHQHVEDDPLAGVPVETVPATDEAEETQ